MTTKPARILYFGEPRGVLHLLDRKVNVVGIVHGRPGGIGYRAMVPRVRAIPRWSRADLHDPEIVAELAELAPTMLVSCFYPRRIPPEVLALAPGINVHPSDLPRWRGPDPAWWAIQEGDTHTAVCVHDLAEGYDEGDVLYRERFEIGPRESGGALALRMEALAAEIQADVVARLVAGETFEREPQGEGTTWAPLVKADDAEIDWTQSNIVVDRRIRAAAPEPGAFSGIGEELLVVFSGTPVDAGKFEILPPGTPFVMGEMAHIRCGEGAFRLGRLQLGRRRLTGRSFAALLV
jgi:methionyl-tRNA formyltransferase